MKTINKLIQIIIRLFKRKHAVQYDINHAMYFIQQVQDEQNEIKSVAGWVSLLFLLLYFMTH